MGFTLSWVRSHFPRSFVHRDFEIRTRNEDLHWVVVEQFFLETPEQNQREGEGKYLPLSYNDGGNLWTIRPHSVCSWLSCSLLFLIADGGRPSGSTAVYDGCVCDYTTYSIYKYATTTSDHVDFRFFIFLTNTWHCHGNYRIHACEVSDPLAPPAWSWQWCAAFPLDSSRSVELAGFAVPFSSVLSKIIQPSPISNMWPRNHLYLCRMRIGTICTHATAGHWFGRLSSCLLSTSRVLFSPIAHTRTRKDILLHKNWLAEKYLLQVHTSTVYLVPGIVLYAF